MSIIVYGAEYSVYTRIVRMALEIKGIKYDLSPVDIFERSTLCDTYANRHPFLKVPAFSHDGFDLFETAAICRYIDASFPAPPLFPDNPCDCARINQIISILDNYAYPCWVWDIAVERMEQEVPDERKIHAALPRARTCLNAIETLAGDGPGLVGQEISLADIYGVAMVHYLMETPEGKSLLPDFPRITAWRALQLSSDWAVATTPTDTPP